MGKTKNLVFYSLILYKYVDMFKALGPYDSRHYTLKGNPVKIGFNE